MRLLVVARQWPPEARSGRAAAFARLVDHLADRHRLRLVIGYTGDREAIPGDALGVDLRGSSAVVARLTLWRASRAAARRFGPDVVLCSGLELPPGPAPTIAVVRDVVGTGWEEPTGLQRRLGRLLLGRYARVVVPSVAARHDLLGAGAPPWRLDRIPDPVDLPPRAPTVARRPVVLVHPGRVLPAKGQHLSIDAVSRLTPSEKERVSLHVVGPVADRRYFDQLRIAARGQPISFHPDDPLDAWLRRAHLVLYPTCVAEGFADAAVQALAYGRVVVYADHPGVRESVGGIGLAVPPEDVESLRATLRRAVADPGALSAIGKQGRRLVADRYSWTRLAPRWEETFTAAKRSRS